MVVAGSRRRDMTTSRGGRRMPNLTLSCSLALFTGFFLPRSSNHARDIIFHNGILLLVADNLTKDNNASPAGLNFLGIQDLDLNLDRVAHLYWSVKPHPLEPDKCHCRAVDNSRLNS